MPVPRQVASVFIEKAGATRTELGTLPYNVPMRLHGYALSALAGVSASSFASFDMFIAPNASTSGYVRFDPINRVSLGTVPITGGSRVSAVAASPNGLYQFGSRWALINNSTGERVSNPSSSSLTLQYNTSGSLIAGHVTNALGFATLNANNQLSFNASWSVPAGLSIIGVVPDTSNRWLVYGTTAAGLVGYIVSDSGTTVATSATLIGAASLSFTGIGQATTFSAGMDNYAVIPYRDNTGAHRIANIRLLTNGMLLQGTQAVNNYSTTNSATMLSAVAGHSGFFLVGADSVTSGHTRIVEYDTLAPFTIMQEYTTSAWSAPTGGTWRMANVVAPEPAEWLAMSVGIVALLGRRRRRPR